MENSLLSKASSVTVNASKQAGTMVLTGIAMTAGAVIFALALKKFSPSTWESLKSKGSSTPN